MFVLPNCAEFESYVSAMSLSTDGSARALGTCCLLAFQCRGLTDRPAVLFFLWTAGLH